MISHNFAGLGYMGTTCWNAESGNDKGKAVFRLCPHREYRGGEERNLPSPINRSFRNSGCTSGRLCGFLFHQFFSGSDDDRHAQDHQKHGYDQLEAFYHEYAGSCGESSDQGEESLYQSRKRDDQHDDERGNESSHFPARHFQEDAQGDQYQGAEQLVCASEQRPDIGIAHLGQNIAEYQGDQGGEILVAEDFSPAFRMLHVIHAEQLLEGHAADACYGVQGGEGQGGYAHGHEALRHEDRDSEHFQKARHAGGKDLERGSRCRRTVCARHRARHAEGDDCQEAFQNHSAISYLEHILFIGNRFGGSAGGNQAVESGHRAAGHRDEQDREQRSQIFVFKTGECGKVHGRVREHQADDCTGDHSYEHEGGHVIAGLHHKPHGKNSRQKDIGECDINPHIFPENDREVHAAHKCEDRTYEAEDDLFPAGEFHLSLNDSEDGCKKDEKQGNASRRTVYGGVFGKRRHPVGHHIGVERIRYHISESRDDDQRKQPAESEEQLAPCFADVLFDQKAHGLPVVFDAGIQRAEVRYGSEENAAQDDPQKNRQPVFMIH